MGGSASAGDSFRGKPSRNAAAGFSVAIDDPGKIAAAAPLTATGAAGNTGTAAPSVSVSNGTDANLFNSSSVVLTSATRYSVARGPVQTSTPWQPITARQSGVRGKLHSARVDRGGSWYIKTKKTQINKYTT